MMSVMLSESQSKLAASDKILLDDIESIESALERELNELSHDGFIAAVSLHDANTLYVSSGISKSLGYQQDMVIGKVNIHSSLIPSSIEIVNENNRHAIKVHLTSMNFSLLSSSVSVSTQLFVSTRSINIC